MKSGDLCGGGVCVDGVGWRLLTVHLFIYFKMFVPCEYSTYSKVTLKRQKKCEDSYVLCLAFP